jgi:hypothetical protein
VSNAVATYYKEELVNWDVTLGLYNKEAMDLEAKLFAIIQQNSIPQRALAAENFLNQFTLLRSELQTLLKQMHHQNHSLNKDDTAVEDDAITSEIKNGQNALRDKMKTVEKSFIELKYNCYNFLSSTYKK